MFSEVPYKIQYDTNIYKFKDKILEILKVNDTAELHKIKKYDIRTRMNDSITDWHKIYYDSFAIFKELYLNFLENFIRPFFKINKGDLVYQKIPNIRIHLVGNLAVGEWHQDKNYNHDSNEMNFWLPFCDTFTTNTIWIESRKGENDVHPYELKYGEILIFNGAELLHGNQINQTDFTRVSVDFRLIKKSKFVPSNKTSINTAAKFKLGDYFDIM